MHPFILNQLGYDAKSLWDKQKNLFWILSYLILICVSCGKSYQREIFGLRDSWQKPVEVLLAHVAPVKEEPNLGARSVLKGSRCQVLKASVVRYKRLQPRREKSYRLLLNCGGEKVSRDLLPGQVDNCPEAEHIVSSWQH